MFEALSKSFLKAFQVAVYLDPKQPGVVIESYTFSFAYNKNDDGTPSPPLSLHVKDNKGREVTLTDARKNFQQITRRLIMITQNLPPLPGDFPDLLPI